MELVFNELSISKVTYKQRAKELYEIFFNLSLETDLLKCEYDNIHKIIAIEGNSIAEIALFNNYPFKKWLDKRPVKEINKKRKFFRMIGTFRLPT